eukprot:2161309-Rhodomonas_salina.2
MPARSEGVRSATVLPCGACLHLLCPAMNSLLARMAGRCWPYRLACGKEEAGKRGRVRELSGRTWLAW